MNMGEALVGLGIVAFVGAIVLATQVREAQVLRLLCEFGHSARGIVTEYVEAEEGYSLTYRFAAPGSSPLIERTEQLTRRPAIRPAPGQVVQVLYLPSPPSISRVNIDASPKA
jgi:hypothetical protein